MRTHSEGSPATKSTAEHGRAATRLRPAAILALAALLSALSGCVDSGERSSRSTYYRSAPAGAGDEYGDQSYSRDGVMIQVESDFYAPLDPYGDWVEIDGYGRCWRPRNVSSGWRPYSDGHWQRTESGWYWETDESWGWATYHYGRWNEDSRYGWYWVPETHWAPAWVSWREGGGYAGWAPLPPRRRTGITVDLELSPRAFVYVDERRFSERVRPSTVIVNNTTIINQTVNITNPRAGNNLVVGEGPRPEVIERASGRRVGITPVRDVRRKEETKVVIKPRPAPVAQPRSVQPFPTEDRRGDSSPNGGQPQRKAHAPPAPEQVPPEPKLSEEDRHGNAAPNGHRAQRETPAAPVPEQDSPKANPPAEDHRGAAAQAGDRAQRENTVAPPKPEPHRNEKHKPPEKKKEPPADHDKPDEEKDHGKAEK